MVHRRSGFLKDFKRCWQLHLFLLIGVAFILIFSYYPMLGIQLAFKDFNPAKGIWGSEWVGFKHFQTFFRSSDFLRVIKNTLVTSLYSLVVSFPLAIVFALQLNIMRRERLKKSIQTITYLPHFISTVVIVGMINQILSPVSGLYGALYRLFSDKMYPPDILGDSSAFVHIYVWSGVWQSLGWDSILYLAALSGVSQELHEAAMLDGANRFQRVIHVDLPSISVTIAIMLILRAGTIMNVGFEKVFLMQNDAVISVSETISTYTYKMALVNNQFSFSTAVSLLNTIVNFVVLFIVNFVAGKVGDTSLW